MGKQKRVKGHLRVRRTDYKKKKDRMLRNLRKARRARRK